MWAAVQDRYGSTDDVHVRDVPRPAIGAGDVMIRVRAAGVDRGVLHLMTGRPYLVRFAGYGLRKPKSSVIGTDLAGVVTEVGSDTTLFRPGDEVFGIGRGTYAEYATADETKLAVKPEMLSFEEAAVTATSGLAALQALRDHGRVGSGQHVLVLGASGGVGTFAIQIAKRLGADVTGVCNTTKLDLVQAIGADRVIDYTRQEVTAGARRFDTIIDTGGNLPPSKLRRILRPRGNLVIVGGETDGRWLGGTDRQLRAVLLSALVSQRLTTFVSQENQNDLLVLKDLVERGMVRAVVDRTYPLAEAAKALRHVADGRARGKVAITIAGEAEETGQS